MEVSKSEKGVVKLVHPGRHVEIHTQPITAAEVMSKNPRHCIARPDVFEFPWIVVRPESVLAPGEVFYIVPNRTIYDLLKAKKQRDQPSTQQSHSQKNHHHHYQHGRSTPKHQQQDRCLVNPFKTAQVNSWPKATHKKRYIQQEAEKKSQVHSSTHVREGRFTERIIDSESAKVENGDQQMKSYEKVVELKSCLRKQGSIHKARNLKVTFVLPTTATTSRIEAESPTEYVGWLVCQN